MIVRIVMFNVVPGTTKEQAESVLDLARNLLGQIPGVRGVRAGPAVEAINPATYQYAFRVLFESEQALQAYMTHPTHQEFREAFFPLRETSVALDFDLT